jgi:D-alanyl-lipoteichoic acid acyltransferase DltB (MBOAT superfamily)
MIGEILAKSAARGVPARRGLLCLGVAANLALLGYFKYANFFVDNLDAALGLGWHLEPIVLPLGISFFTFTQIAYLVDAFRGEAREYNGMHYALFVTYFPHLIAGPVLHHKEMMPQFADPATYRPRWSNFAVGLTIFAIGLFKKSVLADGIAQYATPVFSAAAEGEQISFFIAWSGALAYTFQLYFDFSGYSDMAIGAARLFGVRLPLNFHSPYKATSITEFWRRWHMTLSRFLRDYLYIPLGGNRLGQQRRYVNLFTTMLLGGLWHGAGWTFVVWGGLHGLYLIVNIAWQSARRRLRLQAVSGGWFWRGASWFLTLACVVIGWVFFRADSLATATEMLRGMVGLNGFAIPNAIGVRFREVGVLLQRLGVHFYLGGGSEFVWSYAWIFASLLITLLAPNTQQLLRRFSPALGVHHAEPEASIRPADRWLGSLRWRPSAAWAIATAVLSALGILSLSRISEFLYFQF